MTENTIHLLLAALALLWPALLLALYDPVPRERKKKSAHEQKNEA